MTAGRRCFHIGSSAAVRAALEQAFGELRLDARELGPGDLAVVEAGIGARPDLPGGNAFSACRAWKQRGITVHIVLAADDVQGTQIARYCLADGTLSLDPVLGLGGVEDLVAPPRRRGRHSVDKLLERFEGALSGATERSQSALERLVQWERSDDLLHQLQDPDTGLFNAPYASFKLDEEFKRATRFHLPLALILLDIGTALPESDPDRRAALAEIAAVFLNESRDIDVTARFTATSFLLLLPGTPPDGAKMLAARLLELLRSRPLTSGLVLAPRAGVAVIPAPGVGDRAAFLAVAEACLEDAAVTPGDGGLATSWE